MKTFIERLAAKFGGGPEARKRAFFLTLIGLVVIVFIGVVIVVEVLMALGLSALVAAIIGVVAGFLVLYLLVRSAQTGDGTAEGPRPA